MFLENYKEEVAKRKALGIPPLALSKEQTDELCVLLESTPTPELIGLLRERVNPGVDAAALVKAQFLRAIIEGRKSVTGLDAKEAISMLGCMLGGYNVDVLLDALENEKYSKDAAKALENIILLHDNYKKILDLSSKNEQAKALIEFYAKAGWFEARPKLPEVIKCVCFKVDGETNTDDLSPASEAFTRSDIPLHANSMLMYRDVNAIKEINELKRGGREAVYVGDVVGTGSSRKSAINSIQWHFGKEIPGVPNKHTGGIVIGQIIAPIFYNTAQDSGAMPIVADVSKLKMGDEFEIYPYKGEIKKGDELISTFELSPNTLLDELRAGGRINLIIARALCAKARKDLGLGEDEIFIKAHQPADTGGGYTLGQKMLGKACGLKGVRTGMYIEPKTLTVGSQDTTGPMTRDEIKELAALSFNADFVLQSFCHTAAYPKPADVSLHHKLPEFIDSRFGVSLRPGDGIIHSWLNRMLLPDSVGTGGDSHTRFPLGISFPAGSALVAFAAVTGSMPLNVPETVLVRFKGELQKGVTLRDLVNAIPYFAIKKGDLTVEKQNKKNIFAGKILEIEGLEHLKVEQAFELSDASAERSAAACAIALSEDSVKEYLHSNITLIEAMIKAGYECSKTLARRADKMREWLKEPKLLRADKDAKYEYVLEIDLADVKEPILACPNDPDDVATLSEILADNKRAHHIDEVFVGSCMTNIGHYRALGEILKGKGQLGTRLWVAPPTKMDKAQLTSEGYYSIFGAAGARIEIPGCSLCMGNQARVKDGAVVFSTSTRNFNNRMGKDAKVYLGSAELAAVCAILGHLPTAAEYLETLSESLEDKERIYKYLNFDKIKDFAL